MPRSPRQDYEGAWQHVMNRGIGRQAVFRSDEDRQIFYDCLAAAMPRYGVQVHTWCLLDNHFHLLLFSESGRLSDAMRLLGGRFTQRINYRDSRDGPISAAGSRLLPSRAMRISSRPAGTFTASCRGGPGGRAVAVAMVERPGLPRARANAGMAAYRSAP
jgi:REP element-mobilizing transposase RayT